MKTESFSIKVSLAICIVLIPKIGTPDSCGATGFV
jgi:hypothetical protein